MLDFSTKLLYCTSQYNRTFPRRQIRKRQFKDIVLNSKLNSIEQYSTASIECDSGRMSVGG